MSDHGEGGCQQILTARTISKQNLTEQVFIERLFKLANQFATEIPSRGLSPSIREWTTNLHRFDTRACRQQTGTNPLRRPGRETRRKILRHPVHPDLPYQFACPGEGDIQQHQFEQAQSAVIAKLNAVQPGDAVDQTQVAPR